MLMQEFFYVTNSFAAPMVSDQSTGFVEEASMEAAMQRIVAEYKHPAGLYAAAIYTSADAYHKNEKYLLLWCSEKEEKDRQKR